MPQPYTGPMRPRKVKREQRSALEIAIAATIACSFPAFLIAMLAPHLHTAAIVVAALPCVVVEVLILMRIVRVIGVVLGFGWSLAVLEVGMRIPANSKAPRCRRLLAACAPVMLYCMGGAFAALYLCILGSGDATVRLIALLFAAGFCALFVGFVMLAIVPHLLNIFGVVDLELHVARAGAPPPRGSALARRLILSLRQISAHCFFGFIPALVLGGVLYGLSSTLLASANILAVVLGWSGHASLLLGSVLFVVMTVLAFVQFALIVFCFCRYSLRGLIGTNLLIGTLITLAIALPDGWKALPILTVAGVLLYLLFWVASQDPEGGNYTPQFIRERTSIRRRQMREALKAVPVAPDAALADPNAPPQ